MSEDALTPELAEELREVTQLYNRHAEPEAPTTPAAATQPPG